MLSVVGGVPKYLEEIDLRTTPENALSQLLFSKDGLLFEEFDNIFADVFGENNKWCKEILLSIKNEAKEPSLIAKELNLPLNGNFTKLIHKLEQSAFITRDFNWSISTGKDLTNSNSRGNKVRISDNYTKFYLKFILPRKSRLKKIPIKANQGLELFNWSQIFGLQFENLVLNNIREVLPLLRIEENQIIQIGPYFQTKTKDKEAVQIDCLIQCKYNVLHLIECKTSSNVGIEIIKEIKEKNRRLKIPKGFSIRNHLIYLGKLSDELIAGEFFDRMIGFDELV